MPWTQNKFEIVFQTRSILDFQEDSVNWLVMKDFGSIWVKFGKLLEDKVSENEPLNTNVIFQVTFDKERWKLAEAQKWFGEHESEIKGRITLINDRQDALSINRETVSTSAWGDIDKAAIRNRLTESLEDGEAGVRPTIREMYAVIKSDDLADAPSQNWWGPHHELSGDSLVLNRSGLIAAAGALAGARAEPALTDEQKKRAAIHLIRHYNQIEELDPPESILQLRSDHADSLGVMRYDRSKLNNTEITAQGYLKTDGLLSRTGVFSYRLADGTERRELRLDEDVFESGSMASFANLAVTNGHPPERLNSRNTKKFQVGHTFPEVRRDGNHLRSTLLITDDSAIEDVKAGKTELSNGYTCDLEMVSGSHRGESYDAIQRNIVGNHVAIVDRGRAGHTARLTMDSEENAGAAYMIVSDSDKKEDEKTTHKETGNMAKMKIDEIEVEIPEGPASIVSAGIERRDTKIKSLEDTASENQAQLDTIQGKLDATEAKIKKDEEDRLDEKAIAKMVNDRANEKVVLLSIANKLLDEKQLEKLDEMSDLEIKLAVIASDPALKDLKLDDKTDDYINALFDSAVVNAKDRKDKADKQTTDVGNAKQTTDGGEEPSAEKIRLDMMDRINKSSRRIEPTGKEAN